MALRIPGHVHYGAVEPQRHYVNALINGCMRVAQRGTTFTAATVPINDTDMYLLDRWLLLCDGAPASDLVDVGQETTVVPDGSYAAMSLEVTANDDVKFGIAQVIETRNCQHIIGDVCSLSFEARVSAAATISHLRAAVLAWDGAADTVTSAIVAPAAWGAAGTNPTLAANWTYEDTPAGAPVSLDTLTDAYQRFTIENIAIDTATTTNIAAFIWIDDVTTTAGDILYISNLQLEPGRFATLFEQRGLACELAECQRFFCKTFDYATAPAQNAGANGVLQMWGTGGNANEAGTSWRFPVSMIAAPTITMYNPGAADDNWEGIDGADINGVTASIGTDGCVLFTDDGALVISDRYRIHASAESEL